jgi:hypothetical protein
MTKEKLEELGWQFDDFWANRALFSKKDGKLDGFAIFEHSCDWGIMDPYSKGFELIYCNMTDDEIIQYINYVNNFEEICEHPKDHTFYEYLCLENDMKKFVSNMKHRS